jgi:sortase (surface protein transpeptidase)
MRKPPAQTMVPTRFRVGAIVVIGAGLLLLAAAVIGLVRNAGSSTAREGTEATRVDPPTHRSSGAGRAQRPPTTRPEPVTTTTTAPPDPSLVPVGVRIPEIGVSSPLIGLGLNPDRTLEVPKDFDVAGWYLYRAVPGNPGPGVIAGHVDSRVGPAVFARLDELHAGSTIDVDRSDGSVAVFTVTAVEQHAKDAFPTERVYGPTTGAQLRVITCGGSFDWSTRHYRDNLIVFASLRQIVSG